MKQVSFSDTSAAFDYKTTADLRRAYWLFRIINSNTLVKAGPHLVNAALKIRLPIAGLIKATVFRHFCGGETIRECEPVIERLGRYHVHTILDFSGEGKSTEEDFGNSFRQVMDTVEFAKKNRYISFCVFKVTGMAPHSLLQKVSEKKPLSTEEDKMWEKLHARVESLCWASSQAGIPMLIDAEESWIQPAIDDLAAEMMMKYNRGKAMVYNTVQLYRTDRLAALKKMHVHSRGNGYILGVKLVRGAYLEKERDRAEGLGIPSPLHVSKEDTDRDFDNALRYCMDHHHEIAICAGTHNEKSSLLLCELMAKNGLNNNHASIHFSQLYGMSDHVSFNLAKAGYNVVKYLPFGPVETVMPYLFRRAEENTAIAGQMSRELSLVMQELKRRRAVKR